MVETKENWPIQPQFCLAKNLLLLLMLFQLPKNLRSLKNRDSILHHNSSREFSFFIRYSFIYFYKLNYNVQLKEWQKCFLRQYFLYVYMFIGSTTKLAAWEPELSKLNWCKIYSIIIIQNPFNSSGIFLHS